MNHSHSEWRTILMLSIYLKIINCSCSSSHITPNYLSQLKCFLANFILNIYYTFSDTHTHFCAFLFRSRTVSLTSSRAAKSSVNLIRLSLWTFRERSHITSHFFGPFCLPTYPCHTLSHSNLKRVFRIRTEELFIFCQTMPNFTGGFS